MTPRRLPSRSLPPRHRPARSRCAGTTVVEMAVVLPVFFVFLFSLFEFGHAFMVINTLNAATKKAAREGVADGTSTNRVSQRVQDILGTAIDSSRVTVYVRDASVFDTPGVDAESIDYDALPSIELLDAEPRQLFVVRVEVPYADVAILPPMWIKNITLRGQSVMRHE